MSTLKNIIKPLKNDLKLFQKEFDSSLNSNVRLINIVSKYLIRNRGKNIRPILKCKLELKESISDTILAANYYILYLIYLYE